MTVLAAVAREAARRFPSRVALVDGDTVLTYRQLDGRADEVAGGLVALGVGPGDLVALVLPASADYVVTYLALARVGAVTTGVNPRYTAAERATVLAKAQPRLVITDDELGDGIATELEVVHGVPADGPAPPAQPHDPAAAETVVFTSGTTGTPKGALFTGRQIAAITAIDSGGRWGGGGPQLVATGLPHVGFMTKLAGHLQQGSTMHLLRRWRAADALRLIEGARIPYIGGVAAQVSLLLAVPGFDDHDLGAVQGLIVGGGPSPAAVVEAARRAFRAPYSIRYSSTESGGLGTLTAFDAPDAEALSSVGRPRPEVELRIRGDDGGVVGTGEVGRICLRSPAVMERYWGDPEATAATIDADRWLLTDDLGVIGDDGCLRITGRVSETYIRGGYNVHPQEVEAVLLDHPAVGAVVVVPRPSGVMGEIGVAVVVPAAGAAPPTLDELRRIAGERLAAHKLPEALRVVEALPLTGMDKVDRRALTAEERASET